MLVLLEKCFLTMESHSDLEFRLMPKKKKQQERVYSIQHYELTINGVEHTLYSTNKGSVWETMDGAISLNPSSRVIRSSGGYVDFETAVISPVLTLEVEWLYEQNTDV